MRKLARRRKRQPDDAALRGRVGRLADLAVIGRNRGRVDDDAALAFLQRLGLAAIGREQPQHIERADQIDLDHLLVVGKRHRPVAADDALRRTDAGAVEQDTRRAELGIGFLHGRFSACGIRHVALHRDTADRLGMRIRRIQIDVEQRDLGARCRQHRGCRGAETGAAAGDDRGVSFNIHSILPCCVRVLDQQRDALPAADTGGSDTIVQTRALELAS